MKRPITIVLGSIVLSLLICWLPVSADILHLLDGRKIEGTVTSTTETMVTISTESGVREYPVSAVDYIERAELPEATPSDSIDDQPSTPIDESQQVTSTGDESLQDATCTSILSHFNDKKRSDRTISGIAMIGLGLLFTTVVASVASESGYGFQLGIVTFGLTVVPGALTLLLPTDIEKEHARLNAIPSEAREHECAVSLRRVAESSERKRIRRSLIDAGMAFGCALIGFYYGAVFYAAEAAWTYMTLSAEEQAYETYQNTIVFGQ